MEDIDSQFFLSKIIIKSEPIEQNCFAQDKTLLILKKKIFNILGYDIIFHIRNLSTKINIYIIKSDLKKFLTLDYRLFHPHYSYYVAAYH